MLTKLFKLCVLRFSTYTGSWHLFVPIYHIGIVLCIVDKTIQVVRALQRFSAYTG